MPAERRLSTTSSTLPYLARASARRKTVLSTRFCRRSRTFGARSSGFTLSRPGLRNTWLSRVTETLTASSLSASGSAFGLRATGRSMFAPLLSIGVITMKIISTTSITSTIGVTLMSATGGGAAFNFILVSPEWIPWSRPDFPTARLRAPCYRQRSRRRGSPINSLVTCSCLLTRAGFCFGALHEVVEEFRAGVTHLHVERIHAAGEVVVHPDRGHRDEQTDSGGDEGFGSTAGDRADTGGLLSGHRLERVDDADDGSEQTDERRGGTDGGQSADAALQFGVHDGFRAVESAAGSFDFLTGNLRSTLMRLKLLKTGNHDLSEVALLVTVGNLDGFIELAFAQSACHSRRKLAALFAGRVKGHNTVDHDADRPCGHQEHNDDDRFGQTTHLFPEVAEIPSRRSGFLQQHERPNLHL